MREDQHLTVEWLEDVDVTVDSHGNVADSRKGEDFVIHCSQLKALDNRHGRQALEKVALGFQL